MSEEYTVKIYKPTAREIMQEVNGYIAKNRRDDIVKVLIGETLDGHHYGFVTLRREKEIA